MAQKWSEWDFKSHANFTVWVFILPKLNQKPEEFIYKKTLTSMTQIVSSNKLKWLTFHQSDFDVCAPVVDFLIRCYSFTECDTSPDQTWKAELCSSHALLHLWAAELRESYLTWPWLFFIPAVKLWPWACGYTRVKTTFITPETAVIPRALSSFLLIPPPPPHLLSLWGFLTFFCLVPAPLRHLYQWFSWFEWKSKTVYRTLTSYMVKRVKIKGGYHIQVFFVTGNLIK